ncbi:hypothetical protein E8E12_000385 [Didymella heteroderae]|uniref:Alpha-galactosidase A n=1 Tax=Didymella heteroderae TaxID=1769908 RepID=A0A9P4WFC5_9PLEO|nr:hypothetical protein E8E12_000385 [Didymella heteroderae]
MLQASVDLEGVSEFRILFDSTSVRYITIDPGLYSVQEMCFGPSLIALLPPLPPGRWNQARVRRDPTSGRVGFTDVLDTPLPEIGSLWHPVRIDHLDLQYGRKLRSNVYEATSDRFASAVVAKFARFPWEVPQLDAETMIYERIEGLQIGPRFLGHLTEEGRTIGFVMAFVIGCRHATLDDLDICQTALVRLHRLGIKHGDINKHNFLIHQGTATLIDFDNASENTPPGDLDDELHRLQESLSDSSGRGGRWVEVATGTSESLRDHLGHA